LEKCFVSSEIKTLVAGFIALGLTVGAAPTMAAGRPDLRSQVVAADARLFELFMERCDPAALRAMVTDDFEFFDDRGGLVATDGDAFVAQYATRCKGRDAPDAWRSRREALDETVAVFPIEQYGAVVTGEHVFYERQGDGEESRVGRARFAQMWKLEGGSWKLARVFSYDHGPLP
jgi:hypothetical protein